MIISLPKHFHLYRDFVKVCSRLAFGGYMYEGCQKSSWTPMIKASNEPDLDIHYYISLKRHTMAISQ